MLTHQAGVIYYYNVSIYHLVQSITEATDLQQLKEIISGVVGETCWAASFSYGDELSLDIGAKVPYSQKLMAGKEKGAWMLGTRATVWELKGTSQTIVTSNDDPETARQKVKVIEGAVITAIETNYPELALTVTFSNGCQLILFPEHDEDSDLPYWEMFTPYHMILKVGPGAKWSFTRSDVRAE